MQMNFTLVSLQLLLFQIVSKSVDARTDKASTYVQEGNRTCVSFFLEIEEALFEMIDRARISVRSDVCFCNFFVCISNNKIRRDICTERSLARSKSADLTLVLLDGSSRGRLRGGSILNLLKACASMYRDYLDSFDASYSS